MVSGHKIDIVSALGFKFKEYVDKSAGIYIFAGLPTAYRTVLTKDAPKIASGEEDGT